MGFPKGQHDYLIEMIGINQIHDEKERVYEIYIFHHRHAIFSHFSLYNFQYHFRYFYFAFGANRIMCRKT